jgi:hypothetical protein
MHDGITHDLADRLLRVGMRRRSQGRRDLLADRQLVVDVVDQRLEARRESFLSGSSFPSFTLSLETPS